MFENIIPFRGHTPEISKTAFIAPTASIIGDVKIGDGSGVWYNCVVRGDMNEIRIGENSNVQDVLKRKTRQRKSKCKPKTINKTV